MKYCPTCETRYDEEVLRFCMKDGTPLLDEAEPTFIEMPSDSLEVPEVGADDPSEVTVIRRNIPVPPPIPQVEEEDFSDIGRPPSGGQRIIVPTFEEQQRFERARVAAQYQQPPRSNTALVVLVTMFGSALIFVIGAILFYFLVIDRDAAANTNANANANANVNTGVNTSIGGNTLFDFNTNGNFNSGSNVNANANANTKTPMPTPRPSPSETPSPTPEDDDPVATPTPIRTPIPTPSPIIIRPGTSPSPLRTPAPTPRTMITPANRAGD